jgi:hypothetical protein
MSEAEGTSNTLPLQVLRTGLKPLSRLIKDFINILIKF